MGLLGKLFGGGASIEKLRKAIVQQRYADASIFAAELAGQSLSVTAADEVETLRITAGDELARLNLEEAQGLQSSGNFDLADEHLQLALEQVCSAELRREIEQVIAAKPLEPEIAAPEKNLTNCSSCAPKVRPIEPEEAIISDVGSQIELILTSYPPAMAARYTAKNEDFKTAFLATHAGRDEQALLLWQQLDETDHDDLYWFELGSLLGRKGDLVNARSALETALQQNPQLLLAVESLVTVFIANDEYQLAQELLHQTLEQGGNPAFCHAQLTFLHLQQDNYPESAEHARQALLAGNTETQFILLAAMVLEHIGAVDETERVLKMVPATGCGGATSLPLAEFWLRHNQHLGEILDTFNAACREEPDNPRWQLRVAQTYLARKWDKDGIKLLRKVVADPRLEPELAEEATQLLTELS
ncbi:MAG: hypothetical protein KAU22_08935 [Desulfuromonadales bacterium]|nr:hypothetical protein [Desulfuromonadales bacterium]